VLVEEVKSEVTLTQCRIQVVWAPGACIFRDPLLIVAIHRL